MSGLVSFSLFGDDPQGVYYDGAVEQAALYRKYYSDWDLWFYIGKSVPDSVIQRIREANGNSSFDLVEEPEDQTSTWWRYRAIKHSDHDFIVFRDVDSRLIPREMHAVEEWLDSDFPYHAMRDHQYHGRQLLAGLWGLKRSAFQNHAKMPDSIYGDYYGTDQIALLTHVWTVCRRQIMTHIGCYHIFEKPDQRRPFVVARSDNQPFVAQGFNGDGTIRYPEHHDKTDPDRDLMDRDDIFLEEYRVSREVSPDIFDKRSRGDIQPSLAHGC